MFGRKKRARRAQAQPAPDGALDGTGPGDPAPDEDGTVPGDPVRDEGDRPDETVTPEATAETGEAVTTADPRARGPWDESELPGERDDYVDLGCVLLKPAEGVAVRMDINEATRQPWALNLDYGEGSVQLQAFAAPKSSCLWDDVRRELTEGLHRDGANPTVDRGSLGLQINAKLLATTASGAPGHRVARFVGVDGPRWFLRAVYTGAAATPATPAAAALDDLVRSLVIVRGRDPMAPRDLLPFTVPDTAAPTPPPAGTAPQPSGDGQATGAPVSSPRRGPEITEIG